MRKVKFNRCLILIALAFLTYSAKAQVVHAFEPGDTLYKYSTNLYKDFRKFSDIRLSQLMFPCAEEIRVIKSSKPNTTLELHSSLRKQYLNLKGATMSILGYEDVDPFFGLPKVGVSLENQVPISRSTHKDDFYNKVKSDIFLVYNASDLSGEIKIWADKNSVTQFRVTASLQWVTKYKNKDSFDNLDEVIEGFVIENVKTFSLNTLEVKKEKWEIVDATNDRVLTESFATKTFNYYSFFDYRSLAEKARLNLKPVLSFEYNTLNKYGNSPICNSDNRQVYLFPNPTFGDVKLKFVNAKIGSYKFKLINVIGKDIWAYDFSIKQSDQEIFLPLPDLAKGIYLYSIENQNGERIEARRLTVVNL